MKKSYRPGVYSRYDIISRPHSRQDCYAFYCGAAVLQQGKHLPAGGVVQLSSLAQLREYFSEQGAGKDFCEVCRVLLEGGAAGVYAVPITIDGRKPTTEEYTDAIGRLCEIKRSGVMLCGSCEEEVLQLLCRKVQEASENQKERIGVGAILPEKALAAAKQMNSERMVLCAQSAKDSRLAAAAAIAAMLATADICPDCLRRGIGASCGGARTEPKACGLCPRRGGLFQNAACGGRYCDSEGNTPDRRQRPASVCYGAGSGFGRRTDRGSGSGVQ